MITAPGPALVMGAGAIGCWVGGCLQAAGAPMHFVGHAGALQALHEQGLRITDLEGRDTRLAPAQLHLHERVPEGLVPALVLLCVKSGATAQAAGELAARLPAATLVLSLQNGVGNVAVASTAAPGLSFIPGMVGFNVVGPAPGHWHRGTWGELAAQTHPALVPWLPLFAAARLPLELHDDLRPVQWGKLLLNLNNPVNALSGLPLRQQLLERDLRIVMAALIEEALAALQAHGIRPAQLAALPPQRMPMGLRLPTPIFRLLARRSLRMDDQARTSMAEDLARGRPTEVDALCGEVVRLAQAAGLRAPCNEWMVQRLSRPTPGRMTGREMRLALGL